jgi:hypothetical protein
MAPRTKQAWTRSADVIWRGEPVACFRIQACGILGRHLSEEEYGGLCRVLFAYSLLLNHEYQAATLKDHKKAARDVLIATEALLAAIEHADQPEMGSVVRAAMAETWDEVYDHGAEFERNQASMVSDIKSLLVERGDDDPGAEARAWEVVRGWLGGGQTTYPSQPADMIVLLHEFRDAANLYNAKLKTGRAHTSTMGHAWIEFVGQLTEWMTSCGFLTGPSKGATYGNHGRITYLVKAINDQIPILTDESGKRLPNQMRRAPIEDGSLSGSIIKAQAEYVRLRRRGELGGQ